MPPTCYARGPGITVRHARLHGMGRQFKRVISRVTRVPRNAAAPRRLARLTVPHRQPAGSSLTPRLLSILHPRSDPARVAVRARAPARDGDAGIHERRAGCVGAHLETDDGRRRVHSRRAGRAHPRLHQASRAAGEHARAGGVRGARLQRRRQGRCLRCFKRSLSGALAGTLFDVCSEEVCQGVRFHPVKLCLTGTFV